MAYRAETFLQFLVSAREYSRLDQSGKKAIKRAVNLRPARAPFRFIYFLSPDLFPPSPSFLYLDTHDAASLPSTAASTEAVSRNCAISQNMLLLHPPGSSTFNRSGHQRGIVKVPICLAARLEIGRRNI